MWGYLSEFWNAVSSTTLNAWEYTESYFYSIGNAVAGAIGSLFDFIIHYFQDLIITFAWYGYNLGLILYQILAPIKYIFVFTEKFVINSFTPPILPEEITGFATSTASFFRSLPYWNVVNLAIVVLILFIGGIAIIKLILKL